MATASKTKTTTRKTAAKATATEKVPAKKKKKEAMKDLSVTYNQFKEFEGNGTRV